MDNSTLERHINKTDKVFFLHIPKTAGISFNTTVSDCFDYNAICQHYFENQLTGLPRTFFQPYQYIRGHFAYSLIQQLVGEPLTAITMFRHPIKRYISHVRNWQRGGDYGLFIPLPRPLPHQLSLAEYTQHELGKQTHNLQTVMLVADLHLAQSGDPTRINIESRGALNELTAVDEAIQRLNRFAFFGFTERFHESLYLLSYTFGWLPVFEPPRYNVAPQEADSETTPPDLLDQIASLQKLDLELYHRANELFETRLRQMTHELLERYGGKAHASLGYPLPGDVIRELLEANYRRRFAEAHSPQTHWTVTFDQAISGTGWHPPDPRPPYGLVRWTGPATRSILDLPLIADQDAAVSFCVIEAMSPDIVASLKLCINDELIPLLVRRDENKAFIFEGYVPASVLAKSVGCVRLAFETSRTLAIRDLRPGHPENRPFGLQIAWVKVEPASEKYPFNENETDATPPLQAYKSLLDKQGFITRETLNQLAATESELHDLTHSRLIQWATRLRAFVRKLRGPNPPPVPPTRQ